MFFEKFQVQPPNPGHIYGDAGLKLVAGYELGSLKHEELLRR